MAGFGTGYPINFMCPKLRTIYWRDRTDDRAARHQGVTLTGRVKRMKTGKGHPRKSWTSFEYRCACGHAGWSSHKDLERIANKLGIPGAWEDGAYGPHSLGRVRA